MSTTLQEVLWFAVSTFFLFAYLVVLFQIVVDLFRDNSLPGWAKAIWIVALVFLPMLTALVYLVLRGRDMGHRQAVATRETQAEAEAYIRRVAGTSPAEQIAQANQLLKEGAITDQEFVALKAKALS